jgi:hypothetical protein
MLKRTYDWTEVSAKGIRKWEPCVELQAGEVLPEAVEDYKASEMGVLESMKVVKLDLVNHKVIDL